MDRKLGNLLLILLASFILLIVLPELILPDMTINTKEIPLLIQTLFKDTKIYRQDKTETVEFEIMMKSKTRKHNP